eukprot:CAMPEP_0174925310 /NCGR_PEP_ID=MMETSP1355-20121228/7825_1 /TAXON_ID=464990 /ORGANISM="Hemiselmis tepida, Strain CCMP443" /LENGTH=156 /DNA_ID=CAMNT_0016171205 /DNA_START=1 /DNA_END=470 /DNA_ORIENTATION=-
MGRRGGLWIREEDGTTDRLFREHPKGGAWASRLVVASQQQQQHQSLSWTRKIHPSPPARRQRTRHPLPPNHQQHTPAVSQADMQVFLHSAAPLDGMMHSRGGGMLQPAAEPEPFSQNLAFDTGWGSQGREEEDGGGDLAETDANDVVLMNTPRNID